MPEWGRKRSTRAGAESLVAWVRGRPGRPGLAHEPRRCLFGAPCVRMSFRRRRDSNATSGRRTRPAHRGSWRLGMIASVPTLSGARIDFSVSTCRRGRPGDKKCRLPGVYREGAASLGVEADSLVTGGGSDGNRTAGFGVHPWRNSVRSAASIRARTSSSISHRPRSARRCSAISWCIR